MTTAQTERWSSARLRREFITPELVSGIVLVCVIIAVANESDGIRDVFAITVLSVLVFWATEVFVHTIASQRARPDGEEIKLRESLRTAVHHARGFLFAAILPVALLIAGLFGWNEGAVAYWAAMWVEVAILAIIGWIAFGGRGIKWYWRACGAFATAAFGGLAILLKILIH